MMPSASIDLKLFFPDSYFDITDCQIDDASVIIKLKSKKRDCECPYCHQISSYYHGTYTRKVQDLPMKAVDVTWDDDDTFGTISTTYFNLPLEKAKQYYIWNELDNQEELL